MNGILLAHAHVNIYENRLFVFKGLNFDFLLDLLSSEGEINKISNNVHR